jgi:hypothetical protein
MRQLCSGGSSGALTRQFRKCMGRSCVLTREVCGLTRQFRNATPESLDALNAKVHLKNTLEVLLCWISFNMAKISLCTKRKFTSNTEVQLQQIKKVTS